MTFFKKRIKAFKNALAGLVAAFKGETHLIIHLNAAIIVVVLGFNYGLTLNEWFMVLTCITLVISMELFNSAIELLCNLVMPDKNPKIKYIKDVSAAAVLIAAIFSVIVGSIIFIPKIF